MPQRPKTTANPVTNSKKNFGQLTWAGGQASPLCFLLETALSQPRVVTGQSATAAPGSVVEPQSQDLVSRWRRCSSRRAKARKAHYSYCYLAGTSTRQLPSMMVERIAVHWLVIAAWLFRLCSALEFNTSGANSVKFPDSPAEKLFTQIATDLHRFTKTGIHLDMIEQPYCSETEPSRIVPLSCSMLETYLNTIL